MAANRIPGLPEIERAAGCFLQFYQGGASGFGIAFVGGVHYLCHPGVPSQKPREAPQQRHRVAFHIDAGALVRENLALFFGETHCPPYAATMPEMALMSWSSNLKPPRPKELTTVGSNRRMQWKTRRFFCATVPN